MRAKQFLRRPLLIFAVLLLVPSAGFCVLGWNSVHKEGQFRQLELQRVARDAANRRVRDAADAMERLRVREDSRHYYEYQRRFLPDSLAEGSLAFQTNGLAANAEDPRVAARFQWELGAEGPFAHPMILRGRSDTRERLAGVFGALLRTHLAAAPESAALRAGRAIDYSLHVVAANEERGQLLEEIAVRNEQQRAEPTGAPRGDPDLPSGTPYLDGFQRRITPAKVTVRYTSFRYAAAPRGTMGPPLVAWRVVWVPATLADRRETRRDRYLLQGYALEPAASLPTDWSTEGSIELGRALETGTTSTTGVVTASLATALDAELATSDGQRGFTLPEAEPFTASAALIVTARPNAAELDKRLNQSVRRFLFLVGGLLTVVLIGFVVLMRGVRREVALARRKEDFIAAITHELKTPLTGIRMYADMLKEGWVAGAETSQKYATRILNETERLGHLVNQVLDLAALERGVAAYSATVGDMGSAVLEAVDFMRTRAEQVNVALTVDVAEGLPTFSFDPKLVRPLVLNLLDNAIKYSERSDTKDVRVSVFQDGERVCVRVADKGVGIPKDARKKLFEPFHRAGDELTRSAQGVGIGMALVKRYVDAHRARIIVDSEVGVGTTVTVRFVV